MVGQVKYNPVNQYLEVYDGTNWQTLPSSYATIQLTGEAESLLDWARDKRNEELRLKAMADDHPAIKLALDNLNKAKQQLDATIILSKDHPITTEAT
jgi:hypothetical protein